MTVGTVELIWLEQHSAAASTASLLSVLTACIVSMSG